jgi:hypothetical protein
MTAVIDDPLIVGMVIRRELPVHVSSRRLRQLYPECPRVYGLAVMADVSKRRWWPLRAALTTDRLDEMAPRPTGWTVRPPRPAAGGGPSAHRDRPCRRAVRVEGRAWDTGLENLWVHVDSEGDRLARHRGSDAAGASRRRLRRQCGAVELPGEAVATWLAHRCHRSLAPLFARLHAVSGGAVGQASMWHTVGTAVVGSATQIPLLAGVSEVVAMAGPGRPGRSGRVRPAGAPTVDTNQREGLANLGQPCLCLTGRGKRTEPES